MQIRRWSTILVSLLAAGCMAGGCGGSGGSGSTDGPVTIAPTCESPYPDDEYALDSMEIIDDLLVLHVHYAGGCRVHEFFACWDGVFVETDPVRAAVEVHHDNNGDTCEAWLADDIQVGLATLRQAYQDMYDQASGTVIIEVAGQSVAYSF